MVTRSNRPDGADPDHPKRHSDTAYNGQYPHNRVTTSSSGHERHIDDTPGNERIREAHASGTYYEIGPKGNKVEMVVGDMVHYVKGGLTGTVDKNVDMKYQGSKQESISGHSHTETKGDVTSAVGGSTATAVGGDVSMASGGDFSLGATGKMVMKFGKGMEMKSDSSSEWNTNGPVQMEATSFLFKAGNATISMKNGNITVKVGSSKIVITGGNITVKSDRVDIN